MISPLKIQKQLHSDKKISLFDHYRKIETLSISNIVRPFHQYLFTTESFDPKRPRQLQLKTSLLLGFLLIKTIHS